MRDSLLLYAQAPVFADGQGGWLVEAQSVNGLRLWAENFPGGVVAMAPQGRGAAPEGWVAWPQWDGVRLEVLPDGFRPDRFARYLLPQARRIAGLIDDAAWLVFAIGGLFGDWGAVAARVARRKGRGYAVWTDRVESDVTRRAIGQGALRHRVQAWATYGAMARLERSVISAADVGLFHGAETYEAYAPMVRKALLMHDIHLAASDRIAPEAVPAKAARARAGGPLRIAYAGRVHWSKGWRDWLAVLAGARGAGVAVEASWLGDGDDLEAMRQAASAAGLGDVALPGFVGDRAAVLDALTAADVCLFCHKTRESPRILIEALMRGTPILGYADAYSRDLIAQNGGGGLVTADDTGALTEALVALDGDRDRLADLIRRAAADGRRFDDAGVFRERAEAVRAHVRPGPRSAPAACPPRASRP